MEGDSSPDTAEPMLHDISIHSLRMEGDNVCDCPVCIHCISIHSLRMEGDSENLFAAVCRNDISIHSLRMEGDHFIGCAVCIDCISIHSLRMEGDFESATYKKADELFQSTPSAWRETFMIFPSVECR